MRLSDQVVFIEASPSGVSGDKYLGALLDLGAKIQVLKNVSSVVAHTLPGSGSVEVKASRVERGEIGSQQVTIQSSREPRSRRGVEVLRSAQECIEKLSLSEWGTSFAESTIKTLLEAERKVHGHSAGDVELHELGSADTLIDVLGVACLAESIGLASATWLSTPVTVGLGTTHFSNRTYPNPPPAVAEILRKNQFPMERGTNSGELSTPTGVAITVNLVRKYSEPIPVFTPIKVGYGAGSKDLDGISNVLRLIIGETSNSSHSHEEMVMMETNLDDVTGEVIGRAAEKLMESGARDVTITPVYMKKNRPGHIVSVIALRDDVEKLADILMVETGTLGIRELPILRHISPRKTTEITVKVKGKDRRVRIKLSVDQRGRIIRAKPEYEDLKKISEQTGLSVLQLQKLTNPKLEALQE